MGYRNRLGRIPKTEKVKYQHLTEWDNPDVAPYRELEGFEELFEIEEIEDPEGRDKEDKNESSELP